MNDTNWSAPESEVLDTVRGILDGPGRGVLATIIAVGGSAYRRPGAKMVVPEGGAGVGHITAGCLEDEVGRLADGVLAAGEPRVVRYDLSPEADDDVWGLGVGCNGVIDILLEPLDESYRPILEAVDAGDDIGVVTLVEGEGGPVGARAYYDSESGAVSPGEGFPPDLAERVRDVAADLTERGRADTVEVEGTTVFVDGIAAPADLVVFGTGHDLDPLVDLGVQAGFRVTVVGFRGGLATAERFPAAADVRSTSPAQLREAFDFDADTYVVVATHNFIDDRIAVEELLATPVPYVGLMGPRDRFAEMLAEFREEGRTFTDDELARLYTPVGLDLGGESPHQIALSIVGEVLAVSNGREPGHLRGREAPIHQRLALPEGEG
jgi:xanthine dehydrogenase accessory factor